MSTSALAMDFELLVDTLTKCLTTLTTLGKAKLRSNDCNTSLAIDSIDRLGWVLSLTSEDRHPNLLVAFPLSS